MRLTSIIWLHEQQRQTGKGTSFSETYEEYVDYLINDTLVITAFQNIIDDAHSYYLVAIIDDDIVKIPMKVYPSNDKWCYITRKELNQYGIQQQDGRYFFIGLEYGDLIVINYLTVIDDDILNWLMACWRGHAVSCSLLRSVGSFFHFIRIIIENEQFLKSNVLYFSSTRKIWF